MGTILQDCKVYLRQGPLMSVTEPSEIMPVEFLIKSRRGARASMIVVGEKFVVKAGSIAMKDTDFEMSAYVKLKENLIASGALLSEGGFYRFTKDVCFESASGAAAVVLDRNANGNKEWRHRQSKLKIAQLLVCAIAKDNPGALFACPHHVRKSAANASPLATRTSRQRMSGRGARVLGRCYGDPSTERPRPAKSAASSLRLNRRHHN
jgi:hypothetical protein